MFDATDPTRFILVGTSHAGNVGAAARAMKVMGFSQMVLVAPRFADVLTHEEAIAMSSNADDILAQARVVNTLSEALEGVTYAFATAMTPRDFGPPTVSPREGLQALVQSTPPDQAHTVGFVFGCERYGMSNEDVYACNAVISIPTNPHYGSLNLAQSLQLLAYEWRQALGGFDIQARTPDASLADAQSVQGLLKHWEQALVATGFLDPAAPKKLMPRLNQLFNRAQLRTEEIHLLRGMAKAMLDTVDRAKPKTSQD